MQLTIYTKEDCRPCEDAERILRAEGYDFITVPANLSRKTAQIMREKGVPAIFKGNEYLGSGSPALLNLDSDIDLSK